MGSVSFMEKLLDGVEVEWRAISKVFDLKNGYTPSKAKKEFWDGGTIPWLRMEDIRTKGRILSDAIQHITESAVKGSLFPENSLIMSTTASIGEHALVRVPFLTNQQITNFSVVDSYKNIVDIKFLFYCFFDFGKWCEENANKSGGLKIIGIQKLKQYQIPIPCPDNPKKSLEIQAEIVRILDTFTELRIELTTELTARKKQYNYYRDKLLSFDQGEVEWKTLGEVAKFWRGTSITKKQTTLGHIPVVANGPVPSYFHGEKNREGETIVIARSGAYAGYISFWDKPIFLTDAFSVHPECTILKPKYLYHVLQNKQAYIHAMKKGAGVPHVRVKEFEAYKVPIPSLTEQTRIVTVLDKFDVLTNSDTEGLPREIDLRQKQYEYYRDLLLSFPKTGEVDA